MRTLASFYGAVFSHNALAPLPPPALFSILRGGLIHELRRVEIVGSSLRVAQQTDEAARAHLAPLRLVVEVYVGQQLGEPPCVRA